MITFKTLTLRNFLSYGNNTTTFSFDRPGTTLIIGEDLDNTSDGLGSNGVGKTTLFQALVYALYDRAISGDVTKDGLVNNINKREMEVTLEFVPDNGNTYRVVRQRKMKAGAEGNKTFLYENGKDISVDIAGTNAKIEEVLGMPYEMFVRIIVFSATNESFLKLPATSTSGPNQRDFIEDLFGLSLLTLKSEKLKAVIKDTKAALELKKTTLENRISERDRHQEHIAQAKKRILNWETQRTHTIGNLRQRMESAKGIDVEEQRSLHQRRTHLKQELQELSQTSSRLSREHKQVQASLKNFKTQLSALEDNKCPHCHQPYTNAEQEAHECHLQIEALVLQDQQLYVELTETLDTIAEFEQVVQVIESRIVVDDVEQIAKIQADVANIQLRIEELLQEENPHLEALSELESVTFDDINYDEVNVLQRELDHQNFLLKLLTKSDSFVRKSLLNKYLPFLNGRVQYYLQMLGLPYIVEFKEDLTAAISRQGVEMKFGNLSTGQQARANFALSVAFKDVRERLHGRTNICMFDEVLDFGLDAIGVIACAKVIKHIARTEGVSMYVISHRSEIDGMFDRKLVVQMENKFSKIKE